MGRRGWRCARPRAIAPRSSICASWSPPPGLAAHELSAAMRYSRARQAMAHTWPRFAVAEGSEGPRAPLVVVDYDPAWPQVYQSWRQRIAAVLGRTAIRFELVGST